MQRVTLGGTVRADHPRSFPAKSTPRWTCSAEM